MHSLHCVVLSKRRCRAAMWSFRYSKLVSYAKFKFIQIRSRDICFDDLAS